MLKKSDVKNEANRRTYEKGEYLQTAGLVYQLSTKESEIDGFSLTEIYARVQGTGSKIYTTNVTIDEDYSAIMESKCECEAYYNYTGLCKHCVATLLDYLAKRDQKEKGVPMVYFRGTTNGLKKVMDHYGIKDQLVFLQEGINGNVMLEPFLSIRYGRASVEFRIGTTQMYVMKSIIGFADAMKSHEYVSYGKKLEFFHHIEAFGEESRAYVKFVIKEAEMYEKKSFSYGNYYNRAKDFRNWELDSDRFELFMKAVDKKELHCEIDESRITTWHISTEYPKRPLYLTGSDEGVEVRLEQHFMYVGQQYYYFFDNGTIYKVSGEDIEEIQEFIQFMYNNSHGVCFISKEDLPLFCREMLPVLKKYFICEYENFVEEIYLPQSVEFEIYLDAPKKDKITGQIFAVYGTDKYNLFVAGSVSENRDTTKELYIGRMIGYLFSGYDSKSQSLILENDDEKLYDLLTEGIPKLQEIGDVFVSDAIKNIRVLSAPKVSVGVSLSGELLELTLSSGEMPLDQLVAMLSKYDQKKRFFRLKNGEFVNLDEDGIAVLAELKSGLHLTDAQLKNNTIQLPKYRALYLDNELKDKQALTVQKNKEFKALIRNMKTVEDNDFEIPVSLDPVLREYQKRGFLWLKTLKENGFGGILADDMGLGKTIQVICFLLSEQETKPPKSNLQERHALIVCPASLVYNWQNEILHFAPMLSPVMVVGTMEERKQIILNSKPQDILITSYDLLKRDMEYYKELTFSCEVIDEAQFIKNHITQAARATKMIRAGFRIALTGTPVENRLSELWSIFDYLMPGFLYSYQKFKEELEILITQNKDEEALKRLQRFIRPFVLRRLKKDVLTDLPDKMEENVYAKMEGEQLKLYEAHVQRIQMILNKQSKKEFEDSRFQILAELTKLRQLCCDPGLLLEHYKEKSAKMEMCIELVQNAISGGHKILIFSQFTTMLERLQERMDKEEIPYYSLTGATSKEKRARLVEEFNQNEIPVFCISLKAGGTGLNLTAADIVIHYDPWWNIAVQNQATDRTHRIGQTKVVTVYKLIAKDSIEENIVKLQEMKQELAEQVLGGDNLKAFSFTKEEMLSLLEQH